jgi:hypothetical protein
MASSKETMFCEGLEMNDPRVEIIRIGVSGARILGVSHERVDYTDEAGFKQSIDLQECAKRWGGWHDERSQDFRPLPGASGPIIADWNAGCVGLRGASDDPPWAEFMTEPRSRFQFANDETLYRELLNPLRVAGWHTFDAN